MTECNGSWIAGRATQWPRAEGGGAYHSPGPHQYRGRLR